MYDNEMPHLECSFWYTDMFMLKKDFINVHTRCIFSLNQSSMHLKLRNFSNQK